MCAKAIIKISSKHKCLTVRKDSRLSRMLHVLLHMAYANKPLSSEVIAQMIETNAVVVRRTMAGLKKDGYVKSLNGANGGWILNSELENITLYDVLVAVGQTEFFTISTEIEHENCAVEVAVNQVLDNILKDTEQQLIEKFKEIKLSELFIHFKNEATNQNCPSV